MTLTLEGIWTRFAARLRLFIRGRVGADADAEDVLQDVFVKIQKGLGKLQGKEKLEAWVFQITRNAIADHHRAKRPSEPLLEDVAEAVEPAAAGEGLPAALRRMVEMLPERYREAILWTEFEGFTQQEVAVRLGISLSGAKSRVQRGRALLKTMLLECCQFEFDRRGGIMACEPRAKVRCAECETEV
jgi:RNA polymerase sigma-70 factor (ECF subfamily)